MEAELAGNHLTETEIKSQESHDLQRRLQLHEESSTRHKQVTTGLNRFLRTKSHVNLRKEQAVTKLERSYSQLVGALRSGSVRRMPTKAAWMHGNEVEAWSRFGESLPSVSSGSTLRVRRRASIQG